MADDFAGLKQSLKDTFDAILSDRGIAHNSENEARWWRGFIALLQQKCANNGVTNV